MYRCFVCERDLSSSEEEKYQESYQYRPFCGEHKTIVDFVNQLYLAQRRAGYLSGSTINLDLEVPLTEGQIEEIRKVILAYRTLLNSNVDLLLATLERATENGPEADRILHFSSSQILQREGESLSPHEQTGLAGRIQTEDGGTLVPATSDTPETFV